MKTSELKGAALDWVVAKCGAKGEILAAWFMGEDYSLNYSANWVLAGLIIEREGVCLTYDSFVKRWNAVCGSGDSYHADTPLIAAMRCYVASKLGDEVEIPEELK